LVKAVSGIKTGLNIGIGRQWNANKNFTIDLGLSFSQKGFFLNNISIAPEPWEQNVAFYLETINTTIMINYIETPLVLNYHFMLNEKIGLHLLCGPVFSIAIRDITSREYISAKQITGPFPPYYIPDYYRPQNLESGVLWNNSGLGLNLGTRISQGAFFIEFLYQQSANTVGNLKSILVKKRLQTYNFSLGYFL
jgi:hypothetical protein